MSKESAIVFNIVHSSFVDGYGIRTTFFLKGCPLRCLWCCNPEGQTARPELRFLEENCNLCGRCIPACARQAVSIEETEAGRKLVIDRSRCNSCMDCAEVCYKGALNVYGKEMTVEEAMKIIRRDEEYFKSSGGGVTLGGGEASTADGFCLGVMRECKKLGINVAVDTCGYAVTEASFEVLKNADLLLFDIKGMNRERHIENTGVDNAVIHETLRKVDALKIPVIIRYPLIPGYNDSEEDLHSAADFLAGLSCVERVDIIGFHEYGKNKYAEIGKPYPLSHLKPNMLPQEKLDYARKLFEDKGFKVQFGG